MSYHPCTLAPSTGRHAGTTYSCRVSHHHDHVGQHDHPVGPQADASVRGGRISDAPAIGLVQATAWTQLYADRLAPEVVAGFTGPAFAAQWRRALESQADARHRVLVACAGDQVVGFSALEPAESEQGVPDDAAVLLELVVHPDARRVGHGSRLLNATADTARDAGFAALVVWLPADDEAGRAFADRAGLLPDGAWRDAVVDPDGGTLRQVRLMAGL